MIDRRIEYLLEQLYPHLEAGQLALSDQTAAAVHHLTARDLTHRIDLLATTPLLRPDADRLSQRLHQQLDRIQQHLFGDQATVAQPVQSTVGDDRIVLTLPTGDRPVTLELTTLDPDLQPTITTLRRASRGGMRFPVVDMTTIARQLTMRWLTDPRDPHRCLEIGLAADRVGPETLWTERMAAATHPHIPDLLHIVEREAPVLVHSPTIPRQLTRLSQHGFGELARHLGQSRTRGHGR